METVGKHPGTARANFSIEYKNKVKKKPVSPSQVGPGERLVTRPDGIKIIVKKHSPPNSSGKHTSPGQ